MKRVLSAAVFLPAFWVIVKKFHPGVYEILMTVTALPALRELYRLAAARGHRCHRLLGALVAVFVIASFAFAGFDIRYGLVFGLIALPLASLWRGGDWGPALADIGTTFFISMFIGVLFGYLIDLRFINDLPKGDETGSDLVFLLFFVVWTSDTAAYYVGSFLGRRPLAPRVSPEKTIEGAVGGVAGARPAVAVLGSTGSVGVQALDLIGRFPDRFEVVALSAGRNAELLARQIETHRPRLASIAEEGLRSLLEPAARRARCEIVTGKEG